MKLPVIPVEVANSLEYILDRTNGNVEAVLEEMVNRLPATREGLTIRKFSKENWETLIRAMVYGYEIDR